MKKTINNNSEINLSSIIETVNNFEIENKKFSNSVQINFLRNFTIEGIEPFLKFHLFNNEIKPNIYFGDYNTIHQEIIDTNSHIYNLKPEIIVLSIIPENLDAEIGKIGWNSTILIEELNQLFNLISSKTNALIVVNTIISPFYSETGITNTGFENRTIETLKTNLFISNYVKENSSQFYLVDWDRILRIVGENAFDYRFWYSSKAPFKKEFLNLYALEISKIVNALKGKTKKCIILDCDNTLWGGIIGEDGLKGIKLDKNNYPGKAFYDFQKNVINLYERGVLIALCSKNNEADVWDVFENHPYSVLKKEHISAWRINWQNKAENIASLAKELNLGLNSFVFVDDNPVECSLVDEMLPEVCIYQVPSKLYEYPNILLKDGLFDTLILSNEDKERTKMYQAEKQRKSEVNNFTNIDDYLSTLDIQIIIHEVTENEIPRIAQLTQKTNQFNLTTRRYSEKQIEDFSKNSDYKVYSLSVSDKYGDLGITGAMIVKNENQKLIVDTFLLSCRILGRKIELAFASKVFEETCETWKLNKIEAEYIKTEKNNQTENFWDEFGFKNFENIENKKHYTIERQNLKLKFAEYIQIKN